MSPDLIPPLGPSFRSGMSSQESGRATPGFAPELQAVLGGGKGVDAADEAEALRELFHLVSRLSLGLLDTGALAAKAPGRHPAGPQRHEVESLKRLLRLFLSGRLHEGVQDVQPPEQPLSLKVLFDSLPKELQNLLRRIFPKLDARLQEAALSDAPPALPGPPSRESRPGRS